MLRKRITKTISILLVLCFAMSLGAMAAPVQQDSQQNQGQNQQNQQNQGQNQQNQQSQGQSQQNQGQQTSTESGNQCGTAAQYIVDQGIMKGDGNSNFNLGNNISRADLMIMLVRAFNLSSSSGSGNFGDVNSGDYYFDAVSTTQHLGIALGDGQNFMPNNYVTIEQAIVFIERTADYAGIDLSIDLSSLYDSNELSSYATREDICELLYYVITGYTDGFNGDYGTSHGWDNTYSSSLTVSYSSEEDETVTFDDDDFSDALDAVNDDETLSYVVFTSLPSSSSGGILYDDYDEDDDSNTKVTKNTSYDQDEISDLTFVPASGYSGTVTISFTAYTEDDNEYTGTVKITVTSDTSAGDEIAYETDEGETVTFDGSDFTGVCEDATDETFSYIKFTSLPASSYGVLYLDYDEDDSSHTKITKNNSYDEDDLDNISFVPKSSYTGTFTIAYTGYTEDGTEYTGTVSITVNDGDITADTVTYETDANDVLTLDGSDFASVCEDATDETFSYIKFTSLPASSYGVLYLDYDEDDSSHTKITKYKSYYEDDLDNISFVSKSSYSGTFKIAYTGYTTDGTSYTGTIKIVVE